MRQILYPLMPNDETDAVTVTSQNLSAAGPYAQATQAQARRGLGRAPRHPCPWRYRVEVVRLRGLCAPSAAEAAAAAVTVPGSAVTDPQAPDSRRRPTGRPRRARMPLCPRGYLTSLNPTVPSGSATYTRVAIAAFICSSVSQVCLITSDLRI